jgi:hypothetical protein
MDEATLLSLIVGIIFGILYALLFLVALYCMRRRLISRGVLGNTETVTLSKEQWDMYLQKHGKIPKKRLSIKKTRKDTVLITKNPIVHNTREIELVTPGSAKKESSTMKK